MRRPADRGRLAWVNRPRAIARSSDLGVEPLEARCLLSSTWVAQGPGPIIGGGNVDGITSPQGNNPVAGAIEWVAPLVTTPNYAGDANVVYVATVNGGVWKTTNATAATPSWTPLTDSGQFNVTSLPAGMSLNSIAISPLNANTIFAGAGLVSSYASDGGAQFGIARSTDAGVTWTVTSTNVSGKNIRSIMPTQTLVSGNEIVLAGTSGGVYRSSDGGGSYTLNTTGIPSGSVTDLVGDPGVSTRFYAAISGNLYISNDTGASWALDNGTGFTVVASARVLLSVHNDVSNDDVYAMVINTGGTLSNVYRSANQGTNWTALGVPSPVIFPGTQGGTHGAIVADATDPNTVYISGDRQNTPFPNANGATDYTANVFRNVSGTWQNMVMNGANGTSPHPDSRSMVFDQAGNILQGNDGGIYKLNNPNSTARFWSSLNGNITPTEAHSAAYDPLSKIVFTGTQDNGTADQRTPGGVLADEILGGDGNTVAVDADQTAHPGQSIRYVGFTGLPAYRLTFNASNTNISGYVSINWSITSGGGPGSTINNYDPNIQFYTPFQVNRINTSRILLGTANIYESMDRGATVADLGFTGAFIGGSSSQFGNSPISYGGLNADTTPNPGSFYLGAGATLRHRSNDASSVVTLGAYPGSTIRALVSDPKNVAHVFVLDTSSRIWGSFDEGATWTNLTLNLGSLTSSVRTIEMVSLTGNPQDTNLFVGGLGGVWEMPNPGAAAAWARLGNSLPQVLVYDVRYNATDNVLSAGTLGRGVWTLTNALAALPAWLDPTSHATWDASTHMLNVIASAKIIADPGADVPIIQVDGAAAQLAVNVTADTVVHIASLSLSNGGAATVVTAASTNHPAVVNVPSLSFSTGGTLGLTNNELITTATPVSIRGQLAAHTIFTSTAGGALGYIDAGGGSTKVRFTLSGDTDLNGKVDVNDLGNLATNYGAASGDLWVQGDFDYNGTVDVSDLGDLSSDYGSSIGGGFSALAGGSIMAAQAKPVATKATASVFSTGASIASSSSSLTLSASTSIFSDKKPLADDLLDRVQANTSRLAQANSSPQAVPSLFQGRYRPVVRG